MSGLANLVPMWLIRLGALRARQGDDATAEQLFAESVARSSTEPMRRAMGLIGLAGATRRLGDAESARTWLEQAAAECEPVRNDDGRTAVLTAWCWWALATGDLDAAADFADQACRLASHDDPSMPASAQTAAAAVAAVGSGSDADIERFASLVQQRNGDAAGRFAVDPGRCDRVDTRRTRRRRPVPHAAARTGRRLRRPVLTPTATCLLRTSAAAFEADRTGCPVLSTVGAVEVRLLGQLEAVADDGSPVTIRGAKLRMLVAILALHRGEPVGVERLIADMWDDAPPGNPANALQAAVSQLRRAFGAAQHRHVGCGLRAGDRARRPRHRPLRTSRRRRGVASSPPAIRRRRRGRCTAALELCRDEALVEFAYAEFALGRAGAVG